MFKPGSLILEELPVLCRTTFQDGLLPYGSVISSPYSLFLFGDNGALFGDYSIVSKLCLFCATYKR